MNIAELITFVEKIYPKIDWDIPHGHIYRKSDEQKKYRYLRSLKLNNFSKALRRLIEMEGYSFNNLTSSHYPCFEYAILLNKVDNIDDNDRELLRKLGGLRTDIYAYVSKLINCYTIVCRSTRLKIIENNEIWRFEDLDFIDEAKCLFDKISGFLNLKGLCYIKKTDLNVVVPDIATELTEKGSTTLFNLVFTPLYSQA